MTEPKKDMAKDEAVIKAVGYGFDASVRAGTAAGQKAMEGFMSKLSEEQKMFARDAFNKKIASQSKVLDNKARIAKGEEQVKVYRAAGEAGRKINYQKEFGTKKTESKISAPKKTNVQSSAPKQSESKSSRPTAAKPSPTPKVTPKSVGKAAPVPKLKLEAIPGPTQSQKPATKAPAKVPAKTSQNGPVAKPKATSVGSQRPKASPLKSILNLALPKQGQPPQGFRTSGSGPSSMLVPKFDKKK